jgi:Domain of unknown function (DUF4377)
MMKSRAITIALFLMLVGCTPTREIVLFVAPQTIPCEMNFIGGGYRPVSPDFTGTPEVCIQTSNNEAGPFYPDKIPGFNFEPGFKYKILVRVIPGPPIVDGNSTLEFISVLEKTPAK